MRWVLQHINLREAQEYLDFLNLVTYDFVGPWSFKSGHQAQLYPASADEESGSAGVEYLLSAGFPPSKVVLGIPVYGRSFLGATGPGQDFHGPGGRDGIFDYKDLPRPGTEEAFDTRVVAASCTGADGGFISYDSAQTVALKAGYCRQKGLKVCNSSSFSGCSKPMGLREQTNSKLGLVLLACHGRCASRPSKFDILWF